MHVFIENPLGKPVMHVPRAILEVDGSKSISTIREVSCACQVLLFHAYIYGICEENIRPRELKEKCDSAAPSEVAGYGGRKVREE